jgi:hypothetical protein
VRGRTKNKVGSKENVRQQELETFRNEGVEARLEIVIFFVTECCRSMTSGSEVKYIHYRKVFATEYEFSKIPVIMLAQYGNS